jgi:hypothetical protein
LAAGLAARRAVRLRATFVAPLAPVFAAVVLLGMPTVIVSAGPYPTVVGANRRRPTSPVNLEFLKRDASASTRR